MKSPNDNQFEFQQNLPRTSRRNNQNNKNINNVQKANYCDKKIILCDNEKLGINIEQHMNRIQYFYEQKILKESIKKAVIGTFERKNLIKQGQFQIGKAEQDLSILSKTYVDKIESWLGDSVINSPANIQFEIYKEKKMKERSAKIDYIMKLIQKIALKVQAKKIEQVKRQFQQSLEPKVVKIPENKEYTKSTYKMKFIKQRVVANRKQYENKRQQNQF